MPIIDLFSRRKKESSGAFPDVFQYDDIPHELRVQIIHILQDGLGNEEDFHSHYGDGDTKGAYEGFCRALRREYGVFHLTGERHRDSNAMAELINFFLYEKDIARVLDVIELTCRLIENVTTEWSGKFYGQANNLIPEVNQRLKERGVGYRYISGTIVRVDSEFTHSEIVKPTLSLLRARKLKNVEKEFLAAHEHYRSGEYQDCLTDCGCALESMMKIILSEFGIKDIEKLIANTLAKRLFENSIIPTNLQTQFTSLQSLITSGVPTLRNQMGAHGHGAHTLSIPESVAAYSINLTASNLLLLNSFRKR